MFYCLMFGVPITEKIEDYLMKRLDEDENLGDDWYEEEYGFESWYTSRNGIPSGFLGEDVDAPNVRVAPIASEMVNLVAEGVFRFTDSYPSPWDAETARRVQALFDALPQPMKAAYAKDGIYGPELWVLECAE